MLLSGMLTSSLSLPFPSLWERTDTLMAAGVYVSVLYTVAHPATVNSFLHLCLRSGNCRAPRLLRQMASRWNFSLNSLKRSKTFQDFLFLAKLQILLLLLYK